MKAKATTEIKRMLEIENDGEAMDSVRKLQNANGLEWIYALLLGVLPGAVFLQSNLIQLSKTKMNLWCISQEYLTQAHKEMCLRMFIIALFVVTGSWQQSENPSVEIGNTWRVYIMEHIPTLSMNSLHERLITWMSS